MKPKRRIVTPCDILGNQPTPEIVEQVHAFTVKQSKIFATYGDPRTWRERTVMEDVLPFTWTSGSNQMVQQACYDEWILGAWNHIAGVVKPEPESH